MKAASEKFIINMYCSILFHSNEINDKVTLVWDFTETRNKNINRLRSGLEVIKLFEQVFILKLCALERTYVQKRRL